MKKQFLSILAAGLMLCGAPQTKAMDANIFFGALAATATASHASSPLHNFFYAPGIHYYLITDLYIDHSTIQDPDTREVVYIKRIDAQSGFQISYRTVHSTSVFPHTGQFVKTNIDVPYRFVPFVPKKSHESVIQHETRIENQVRAIEHKYRNNPDAIVKLRAQLIDDKNDDEIA